jgi:hypothetical protein
VNCLRPEAETLMKRRAAERQATNVCHGEYGWPVAGLLSEPMKIVQTPRETMILYQVDNLHRQVFTDGHALPATFEVPAYPGYFTGHWDRDTFVVESRDAARRGAASAQRSSSQNVSADLDHELTFDDPEMHTRKFTVRIPHELVTDNDIFEMLRSQNE